MRLSGGGQNGEGGQVDKTLWWVGVAEHLHGPRGTRYHDLWNLLLMFNGQWVSCHVNISRHIEKDQLEITR